VVYFDKNGAAEFDGKTGFVPYVYGGGAATNVFVALEDGDVGGYVRCGSVKGEVVGCGGSTGASA
jgi:hypothetical protein